MIEGLWTKTGRQFELITENVGWIESDRHNKSITALRQSGNHFTLAFIRLHAGRTWLDNELICIGLWSEGSLVKSLNLKLVQTANRILICLHSYVKKVSVSLLVVSLMPKDVIRWEIFIAIWRILSQTESLWSRCFCSQVSETLLRLEVRKFWQGD